MATSPSPASSFLKVMEEPDDKRPINSVYRFVNIKKEAIRGDNLVASFIFKMFFIYYIQDYNSFVKGNKCDEYTKNMYLL